MKIFLFSSILMAVWVAAFVFFDLGINVTPSLPLGLYRQVAGVPEREDLATFCLPEELADVYGKYVGTGSCPSGLRPLLKHIAAISGDRIEITHEGLRVNGRLLMSSMAVSHIPSRLQAGVIPAGKALLFAAHPKSLDSRYFGLADSQNLRRVTPIWIFGSTIPPIVGTE